MISVQVLNLSEGVDRLFAAGSALACEGDPSLAGALQTDSPRPLLRAHLPSPRPARCASGRVRIRAARVAAQHPRLGATVHLTR